MNNHTDLLNYLATTFNLQSYLEIGVSLPENNFDKIICEAKTGVDVVDLKRKNIFSRGADKFFEQTDKLQFKFDLIFLDGLHHADQVKRDFENSLRCLNDKGIIVIHDTLPEKEEYTHVPRDSKIWNGDVYKFACNLGYAYEGINYMTLMFDHGCTVVWKESQNFEFKPDYYFDITWEEYQKYKQTQLNLKEPAFFKKLLLNHYKKSSLNKNIRQLS